MTMTHVPGFSRKAEILRYTAWRLDCPVETLESPGTVITEARGDIHPWLLSPYAAERPDVVCIFRRGSSAVVRVHPEAAGAVRDVLASVTPDRPVEADHFSALPGFETKTYKPDPYFYLEPHQFRPAEEGGVRVLVEGDRQELDRFRALFPSEQRWFVEMDHPVLFGR
ncbi:MAG: hypothetical protein ACYTFG_17055, partial [Planctomycetota bacterium]